MLKIRVSCGRPSPRIITITTFKWTSIPRPQPSVMDNSKLARAVPIYVSFRNSKYDKDCEISQKTMTMKLEIEEVIEKTFDILNSTKHFRY